MTTRNPFASLMEDREEAERRGAVPGVRYAQVARREDDGYILTWLSGSVTTESAPARVATMMAGDGYGTFYMPEVGHEVVVGFEEGDIDRPVILGCLWSPGDDQPPSQADNTATNNVRTTVSRSGHELTFDDSPGAGRITLRTAGGLQIVLDDQQRSITIEVSRSNRIVISPTGVSVSGTFIDLN